MELNPQDITFEIAGSSDKKKVQTWLKQPHVKEYWDATQEIWTNFTDFIEGDKKGYDYWICLYKEKPYGLIRTSNALMPDPKTGKPFDPIISWVESEGATLIIDLIIAEEFLGKGLADLTFKRFSEIQEPEVSAFLVTPEVKEEKAMHVYEKAGFVKVSTFIRGQGFFKGKPHYILKLRLKH